MITADVYGAGAADRCSGARSRASSATRSASSARSATTSSTASATGRAAFRASPTRGCAVPASTPPTCAGRPRRSLERVGVDRFDLLLLHNPDRTGFTSEAVWDGMAALRDAGLADAIGVAPGPANGFTLDLIDCFERFGDRIDWAMVILNPLEPWPGELCLGAAAEHGVRVITRVVDYGGLFWDDVLPGHEFAEHDHRRFRPDGLGRGRAASGSSGCARSPSAAGLTPIGLACQWNLAHDPVACVAPTLIQEAGPDARPIEDKRAELAALPPQRLSPEAAGEIRAIGDNTGSMTLKGASPEHEGDERAGPLDAEPGAGRGRAALGRRRRARPAPRPRRSE